jgi:hypothetical protein
VPTIVWVAFNWYGILRPKCRQPSTEREESEKADSCAIRVASDLRALFTLHIDSCYDTEAEMTANITMMAALHAHLFGVSFDLIRFDPLSTQWSSYI